jgi:predicted DNA binding CopG/RHH family protein
MKNEKYNLKFDPEEVKKWELDDEEKKELEAIKNTEWVRNFELENDIKNSKKEFYSIDKNGTVTKRPTPKKNLKNKSIHLKLTQNDFEIIKEKSIEDGILYQTILGSIIHKFASNVRKHKLVSQ